MPASVVIGLDPKQSPRRTQDTIIVTPMVQALRGETPAWAVVVPIGIVAIVVLALLRWLLVSTTAAQRPGFALRP